MKDALKGRHVRYIKQITDSKGRLTKDSEAVEYVEIKLWQAELRAHIRCIRNISYRLNALILWNCLVVLIAIILWVTLR